MGDFLPGKSEVASRDLSGFHATAQSPVHLANPETASYFAKAHELAGHGSNPQDWNNSPHNRHKSEVRADTITAALVARPDGD